MEWNEKLQKIIDYVELHLQRKEEPVNPDEIAQIAGCSFDFFQKVFSYMNGVSFAEYIRYRKLTLAGYTLKSTDRKVIDVSYQYGYDSPTSFTKAFQKFHGVSPKEARDSGVELQVFPKMRLSEPERYSWEIMQKPSLRLIGKSTSILCNDNLHHQKISEFWSDCQRNGTFSTLIAMDEGTPGGLFGLIRDYDEATEIMEYAIMVNSDQEIFGGFDEIVIPEAAWAVFHCKGPVPQAMQNGWKFLHEEWLVKYPFQHAPCPELEWYSTGNSYSEDYLSQIWIPIILWKNGSSMESFS